MSQTIIDPVDPPAEAGGPVSPAPGGLKELVRLAWPLALSSSFWTIQLVLDAIFLAHYDTVAAGAVMVAGLLFWTSFVLLQTTTNYATTFVAQYVGAGRPERVGPVVWQALYFGVFAGVSFMGLYPAADWLLAQVGHAPRLQAMEATYLKCMVFAALPMLIIAACNSFFAGRGESRVVLLVDAVGTLVNVALGYCLIFGKFGLPEYGVAGAGWAVVCGSWIAALTAFTLLMRKKYRETFATISGWRFDPALFKRLMRFGIPSGMQWTLDCVAFTVFVAIVGLFGETELAASGIAQRINMLAFLPMLGVGQAVAILVGQRLGENRPDLAERSANTGLKLVSVFMTVVAILFVAAPFLFIEPFHDPKADPESWNRVAETVRVLLWFIAIYSLFNSIELVYTFTLRGAGDTVFVTWVSLTLAWPIMVLPTFLAYRYGWNFYWTWGFASAYIIAIAGVFMLRFRHGKWKTMRVIEQPADSSGAA
jgi:MATE family multidrug resistance protein